MSKRTKRTETRLYLVVAKTYYDDYKASGDSVHVRSRLFSKATTAEKYVRHVYREAMRERASGSDYETDDKHWYAEQARERSAFLKERHDDMPIDEFTHAAAKILRGDCVKCTFEADIEAIVVNDTDELTSESGSDDDNDDDASDNVAI